MKQCYLSSFNTKPESKYIEQLDTFPGAPNRFLSYVSFEGRNENKLSNNFTNCSVHVRDCVLYLKNLSDILSTIGQYYVTINPTANNSNLMVMVNANLNGNASPVTINTTTSNDGGVAEAAAAATTTAAATATTTPDVDQLLKDIRSYILTTTTNATSSIKTNIAEPDSDLNWKQANLDDQQQSQTGTRNGVDTATSMNTFDTLRQRQSSSSSTTSTNSNSSSSLSTSSSFSSSNRLSSLFTTILSRLVKLLHGCIDSESSRYEFYRIFSEIINCPDVILPEIHKVIIDLSFYCYQKLTNCFFF